ncbi:MAG: CAP domain-containing protein [Chromatiales bacterium]
MGPDDALDGLNRIRTRAGLTALAWSSPLARAARGHAAYLAARVRNDEIPSGGSLHQQVPDTDGFTGESPAQRALRAGYPHRKVRENVSVGTDSAAKSLDGLMTAIYHRLAFLDLEADEVGIARKGKVLVYLLGRSDYTALCRGEIPEAIFEPPALCVDTRVDPDYMDSLCDSLPAEALFQPPYDRACPGGLLLDRDYMARWCASPPPAAILEGSGAYYRPCDSDLKVDAGWWRGFCESPPEDARYGHSGSYYEICGARRVHADWLERRCSNLPENARYGYDGRYLEACAGTVRMHAGWRDRLDARRQAALPDYIVWPPDGAEDAAPAFYEEQPDPLPGREVSGNPLSVQVNPRIADGLSLGPLQLHRIGPGGRRTPLQTQAMDADSDPNGKLQPSEHAFFPLEHLGWGQRYEAEARVERDGSTERLRWRFTTRDPGARALSAGPDTRRLSYPRGRPFALFIPPTDAAPRPLGRYTYRAPRGARVDIEPVDYNTVRLEIAGADCHPLTISPAGRAPVELRAEGCPR